jgi:hypothetical protein
MALMGYLSGPLIDYDFNHIVLSILHGLPVYISAISLDRNAYYRYEINGHAWIIDNYVAYLLMVEIQPGVLYQGLFPYVHCNFGWDGDCDGWYASGIFNTAAGPSALDTNDDPYQPNPHNYQYQQQIIPYIQPVR